MEDSLHLTDIIDLAILQEMQASFSKMTGMAAAVSDVKCNFITATSCPTDFCSKYTRATKSGADFCKQCNITGAQMSANQDDAVTYHCHAGLVAIAAVIKVNGEMIGCLHGGQFIDTPLDDAEIAELANEIGIDPREYVAAYHKLPFMSEEKVNRAVSFLHTITAALSSIATHNYIILQENAKIKRATSLKSDFLANTSHEIRTPMNAIIGMAEMALREELTLPAREHVNQIKSSGKNLLMIINDILDFSKIESEKMEINMGEYEPMSLINDVSNIIMTHIAQKDVQLILDISPDIPYELLGDSLHIKQILLNLTNNAVKFTKNGYITLKIKPFWRSEDEVILQASIKDTGIGIKKADLENLFQSFQQVDSKRNRSLEGTGLGLAISQRLLHLMMGSIDVKSEFGKGSTFTFKLPQRVTRGRPSIKLNEPIPTAAAGLIADPIIQSQLHKDIQRLNIHYIALESEAGLTELTEQQVEFLFIESSLYSCTVEAFVESHPKITAIRITDFHESVQHTLPNLLIAKKPIYSLNLAMIFNRESLDKNYNNVTDEDYEFIAPEAKILIVDDNTVNLTVAEGLLKPLKLQIDTAQSGKEAINRISITHYDLIFMDHQMPDIDGIETTHIIRRFHDEYANVPIIAFSAMSSTETEMMFLNEGLNDCVAKPFELRMLISKLKRWLPKEKIQKISDEHTDEPEFTAPSPAIQIQGLDTAAALSLLGDEKLLWAVLRDYYQVIRKKAEKIRQFEQEEDWKNYTIEVHALKSASKQIGAMELSSLAADMEKAGNDKNAQLIHQYTGSLLEQYLRYDQILAPYFTESATEQHATQAIPKETLLKAFSSLHAAIGELDMDKTEAILQEIAPYHYESWQLDLYQRLKSAASELDADTCESILTTWENKETNIL